MASLMKKKILTLIIAGILLLSFSVTGSALEKVSLQLIWKHQFQFAGYYVAKEKGFYKDVGLEVDIREYNLGTNVTQDVLSQKADFGVGRSAIIMEKLNGKSLFLLAAIYQHSPYMLLARDRLDLKKVAQLKDKNIMILDDEVGMASLTAMLTSNGVTAGDYQQQAPSFNVDDLIEGKTDAISAYISNEPYQMDKRGVPYTVFSPRDHGFDFYSDILYTSQSLHENKPDLVKRFYQASLKGWGAAFANIDETAGLILDKYNTQNRSRGALLYEGKALKKMAIDPGVPLGNINQNRINQIAQVYRLLGLSKSRESLKDFYFKPEHFGNIELPPREKTQEKLKLTESEKSWIKAHPVIRVHNEMNWPPFNFNVNGKPTGLSIDYMNLLAKIVGLEVKYISGEWDELLNMTFDKQLDVMLNIVNTPERRKHLLYTGSYLKNPNVIIAKEGSDISGIESLFGKRVSFPSGFFYEELLKNNYPEIKRIPVKDSLASLKAVQFDRADAALGELAVINYLIRDNHLTGLVVQSEFNTGNPETEKLNIAMRNDWPELQSILVKAMVFLDEEEIQKLKYKWLLQSSTFTIETQKPQQEISAWRLSAYGIAIFLIVSFLFWFLIKVLRKGNITIKYGSTWFRLLVLAGLSFFLVVVFLIGWINLERNRETHQEEVNRSLYGALSIFQNRLDFWLVERKSYMKQLGFNPELVELTKRLLEVPPEKRALLASDELGDIRSFFKGSDDIFPNIGFFVINSDYISVGSMRDTNVGTLNLISKQYPDLLKKAFQGEVGFVPPIPSDVHLGASKGKKKPPTMFFIGPIRDLGGRILAVFTLRVDPWRDFSKVVTSLENLNSGEIYAFDKNACLLTPSRFDEQLRRVGLLDKNEESTLNIEIRDPGVNLLEGEPPTFERSQQPLTRMVQGVIGLKTRMEQLNDLQSHSKIESATTSYRDYRGVPVYGSWMWNSSLQVGLTAEIDVDEALAHYYQTRLMVIGILGFTLFLSVCAVLLVLVLGERASRALIKARDNLEDEVEKRTAELRSNQEQLKESEERSLLLLYSVGEGIFGVDTKGKINFINPSGASLLGYEEDELIGQEAHSLIHHSHADGTIYNVKDCPMYHSFTLGTSEKVLAEVLWRKDGSQFDVEYSSTPIKKDNGIIGAVITFLDVSERKKAEEKIRKSEELLTRALKIAKMGGWEYVVGGGVFWTQEVYDIHGIERGMVEKYPERNWVSESINCYQKEDARRIEKAFSDAVSKGIPYDMILRFKPFEGSEKWVRATAEPVFQNGKVVRVIGLLADVDEQKKMEEALIAEKAYLQKILDTSPVGVGISVDGVMRFTNPRIRELLEFRMDNSTPHIYVNIEDRNYIMKTLDKHGIIQDYELQMFGKNNEIKDMLATYMTIAYEGKEAILGWIMDITELKKTDQELRKKFDELSLFRKLAVGRELKMIEFKQEINELLLAAKKDPKYEIAKKPVQHS
jgi:PAS domain S-box-containing protein